MQVLMTYFMVAFGGALGACARYGVNIGTLKMLGDSFPYATMFVNIVGSFMMGALVAYFAHESLQNVHHWKLFLITGFLGAFTTFSAFSLDFVILWERGDIIHASVYAGLSVMLSIGALIAGMALMRGVIL